MFTRRYGPLRGPTSSSCGGLWPSALRAKKRAYYAVLANFKPFLVETSVTLKKIQKVHKKSKKIQINPNKSKKIEEKNQEK